MNLKKIFDATSAEAESMNKDRLEQIKRATYDHIMGSGIEGFEVEEFKEPRKKSCKIKVKVTNPYGYGSVDAVVSDLSKELMQKDLIQAPAEFYDNLIQMDFNPIISREDFKR